MPSRILPRTNTQRLTALRVIAARLPSVPPDLMPLPAPLMDRLTDFLPVYEGLLNAVKLAKARQSAITSEVKPLRHMARIWVRQGYQNIIDAVTRGVLPRAAVTGYGLALDAKGLPPLAAEQQILDAAERLQDAEGRRVAAGGIPMAFPSMDEIMQWADAFRDANLEQAARKSALADAQKDVKKANREADRLILRLWNTIEAAYNNGNRPSMRRRAREWGIIYSIAKARKQVNGPEADGVSEHD